MLLALQVNVITYLHYQIILKASWVRLSRVRKKMSQIDYDQTTTLELSLEK